MVTTPPPTQPGVVLGTVGYMAPEQVRGLPVDHRADLFALGAILYELLSGRRAFSRDTAPETMAAILKEDPPELNAATPMPPALVRIVNRCLEKSPSTRFQTASDLAFALGSVSETSSASTAILAGRSRAYGAWLGWAAALLLLATLAPLAYQHLRERPLAPSADALPDSPDRRVRGARKFRPLSGRPSPGFRGAWSGWHRASLDPDHGFAGGPASSGFGDRRHRAATFLVSRRTVRRVRCRRQAQEGGHLGRPASNVVRSAPWECRRGRLLESRRRHHLRELRRSVARPRDRRCRVSHHDARSVAEGGIPSAPDLSSGRPSFRVLACVAERA